MTRIQITGCGIIVVCGIISQFTIAKESPWMVWVLALASVAGMIMVLSEWFRSGDKL